jgi:TonB family protein
MAAPPIRIALRIAAEAAPVPHAPPIGAVPFTAPDAPVAAPAVSQSSRLSPSALLLVVWLAGAALFLLPVIVGLRQVRRLRRTALPWRHGQTVAEGLAFDAGVPRRIEVLLHEELPGPMMCGVLHPAIVLPVDAPNWKEEDLNRALVHEIEHVRRGDWASHCLARAVCAAYWFHPLVWMAWRRLVLDAERACDDAVLARSEATAYADQLVAVAQRLSAAARPPLLAMASRADLAKRVGAVLDSRQRRGRAGAAPVALACAAAMALVLSVAPLKMVAAPEPFPADITADAPIPEPAPLPAPAAKPHVAKPTPPVLMAAAPQAAAAPPAAGAPMARFSAGTMLVSLDVTASYPNGTRIEGLTASDFAIAEDGVPQRIVVFEYQKLDSGPSSYYILGYYTPNLVLDGKFRKISVTLPGNAAAKLDCREGYSTLVWRTNQASSAPGPGVTFPQLQHKVEPEYSEPARQRKFQGTVVLLITVNTDGKVGDMHVLRTLGLGLDEKAIEAVEQWKFIPGTKDLVAVPMQAQVEVNFRLM